MVSFEVNGSEFAAHEILNRVKLFTLAGSLGGVESIISYPPLMSHAAMPASKDGSAALRTPCCAFPWDWKTPPI